MQLRLAFLTAMEGTTAPDEGQMVVLNKRRNSGHYRDRDIGCQEALEPVFPDLAKGLTPDGTRHPGLLTPERG
ncbi:hypothetical protein CWR43_15405 [Rhizobium sullae]|uniref:Uncharacterized protein n=2 Tax=Rhizobium sullae TaxID=50338 RepID=A0A2N0D9L3_RHISU|nr:hypothetical protein CWR43_15405 [Rhizobium sullae]